MIFIIVHAQLELILTLLVFGRVFSEEENTDDNFILLFSLFETIKETLVLGHPCTKRGSYIMDNSINFGQSECVRCHET